MRFKRRKERMINPFKSDEPVTQKNFFGREKEVEILGNRICDTLDNYLEEKYIILSGRRGHGKTSLLEHVKSFEDFEDDILFITVRVSSEDSYEQLLEDIISQILRELRIRTQENSGRWGQVVSAVSTLSSYIDGFSVAGMKISWSTKSLTVDRPETAFIDAVPELWEKIKSITSIKGLVICLDELDALEDDSKKPMLKKLAYGLKTIADHWKPRHKDILIIVSSLTHICNQIMTTQMSLERAYECINIGPFTDDDINDMFSKVFNNGNPQKLASQEYIDLIKKVTGGVPWHIQEISRVAFQKDNDGILSEEDLLESLPQVLESMDVKTRAILSRISTITHGLRSLRMLAAFKSRNVRRSQLLKALQSTFNGDYEYIIDDQLETIEEEYKETNVTYAIRILCNAGLVNVVSRGTYKIVDPITDCWINYRLSGYSLEDSIARTN